MDRAASEYVRAKGNALRGADVTTRVIAATAAIRASVATRANVTTRAGATTIPIVTIRLGLGRLFSVCCGVF